MLLKPFTDRECNNHTIKIIKHILYINDMHVTKNILPSFPLQNGLLSHISLSKSAWLVLQLWLILQYFVNITEDWD